MWIEYVNYAVLASATAVAVWAHVKFFKGA